MRAWVSAGRWSAAAAAGLLAGCDEPSWLADRDPAPPLPAWAAPLVGRPLQEAFARAPDAACVGNTEQVEARYAGARPGAKITGWGWDAVAKAPVARVLITSRDGAIAGAGEAGLPRPDVAQARPEVTSVATGWSALTTFREGEAQAWGVLADGARVCKLGRIAL